jgi:glycolate oxidase iron-sulfur subunit
MASAPRGFSGPDQPDRLAMERCVQCGLCLPHCPTYRETLRETSSPRGRIHLIKAVARGELDVLSPGFVAQMHQCLDCRACEAVCPSGVEYGHLVEAARAQIAQAQKTPARRATRRAIDAIFGDLGRFRAAAATLRRWQQLGGPKLAKRTGIARIFGFSGLEDLAPPVPGQFFIPAGQRFAASRSEPDRAPVALFAGCVMSTIFAPTDRATVRVLNAWGWPVLTPAGQGCCGAIAAHTGEADQARAMAQRNIAAWEASGAGPIANNAAGCGSLLKDYGHLLASDPVWAERARRFGEQVRDASELLAEALDAAPVLHPVPLRVTFQDPCHLAHAQRITRQPRDLLRVIPKLDLVEMEDSALCCGSAGIYNLTQPEMARRLQQRKITSALATGADLVVTANPGCLMQVRAGLRAAGSGMGVIHLMDLLDASLRGLPADTVLALARR